MQYLARVGATQLPIDVAEPKPNEFQLQIGEQLLVVYVEQLDQTSCVLRINHQVWQVELTAKAGGLMYVAQAAGQQLELELGSLRQMFNKVPNGPDSSAIRGADIVSPMPARVVAVLVSEGQRVEAGDSLVVVEAMKMENELRAPHAGIVCKLQVETGLAIAANQMVCRIESQLEQPACTGV